MRIYRNGAADYKNPAWANLYPLYALAKNSVLQDVGCANLAHFHMGFSKPVFRRGRCIPRPPRGMSVWRDQRALRFLARLFESDLAGAA